ncbi:hypothetical protein ACE0DR_20675 [Azotobacter sp. CWF10]
MRRRGQAGEAVDERIEVVFTSSETVPPDKTLWIQVDRQTKAIRPVLPGHSLLIGC